MYIQSKLQALSSYMCVYKKYNILCNFKMYINFCLLLISHFLSFIIAALCFWNLLMMPFIDLIHSCVLFLLVHILYFTSLFFTRRTLGCLQLFASINSTSRRHFIFVKSSCRRKNICIVFPHGKNPNKNNWSTGHFNLFLLLTCSSKGLYHPSWQLAVTEDTNFSVLDIVKIYFLPITWI